MAELRRDDVAILNVLVENTERPRETRNPGDRMFDDRRVIIRQVARHDLSFRDYGGLLDVSGTTPAGHAETPQGAAFDSALDQHGLTLPKNPSTVFVCVVPMTYSPAAWQTV